MSILLESINLIKEIKHSKEFHKEISCNKNWTNEIKILIDLMKIVDTYNLNTILDFN
jgi:hypothetical protein